MRVFEDVISGKTLNRPGLAALLDHARPNDTLAVIQLGRLGRSLKEILETVHDLNARVINLISLEERIDTMSDAGELVFHVLGAIAHFERRLISERTKDEQASVRKHGRNPGRPPLHPKTILAQQNLVEVGKSVSQAAKHLGIGESAAYKVFSEARQRYMFAKSSILEKFSAQPSDFRLGQLGLR